MLQRITPRIILQKVLFLADGSCVDWIILLLSRDCMGGNQNHHVLAPNFFVYLFIVLTQSHLTSTYRGKDWWEACRVPTNGHCLESNPKFINILINVTWPLQQVGPHPKYHYKQSQSKKRQNVLIMLLNHQHRRKQMNLNTSMHTRTGSDMRIAIIIRQ